MSILDDAIREHLELKRAHGADEAELKRLEDEAFGPPQRPDGGDAFGEAPTEFLTAPAEVVEEAAQEVEGRRMPNIADLQEGPPREQGVAPSEAPEASGVEAPAEPDVEEHLAMEHEAVAPPEEQPSPAAEQPDGVHTTEEREAIADQPTQFFDVQAELDDTEASPEGPEVLASAETAEEAPEAAAAPTADAPDPVAPEADSAELDEDDFFSDQRLSEELDQALEAPVSDAQEELPVHEALPPESERSEPVAAEEPTPAPEPAAYTEEGTAIFNFEDEAEEEYEDEDDSDEENAYEPETGSHEDVLEDRPTFLEDEEDDVWFEQRPPKDFDLD